MSDIIGTKMHEVLRVIEVGRPILPGTEDAVRELIEAMQRVPLYVLDRDIYRDLPLTQVVKSMRAMEQCGVLRLPFPELLMELWSGSPNRRLFAYVTETGQGRFQCSVLEWLGHVERAGVSAVLRVDANWQANIDVNEPDLVVPPGVDVTNVQREDAGFEMIVARGHMIEREKLDVVLYELSYGLMISLMMTNIAGLDRQHVSVPRLNKARAAQGKPSIPDHVVVHIGHVYDREGRAHRVSGNDAARRAMSVHMRAAHTRWQHHGPKWVAENPDLAALPGNTTDGHRVLIEAVLVNYRDGTDLATPLPRLVRA